MLHPKHGTNMVKPQHQAVGTASRPELAVDDIEGTSSRWILGNFVQSPEVGLLLMAGAVIWALVLLDLRAKVEHALPEESRAELSRARESSNKPRAERPRRSRPGAPPRGVRPIAR
jgi:hypothetical protein